MEAAPGATEDDTGAAACGRCRLLLCLAVVDQRRAGLEQGLEAGEHAHPARPGDACGRLRRVLELVVDEREQRRAVVLRLELPGHPALGLGAKLLAPLRP